METLNDMLHLARLFHECGELQRAVRTVLGFLQLLNALMPYMAVENGQDIIRKDNKTFNMNDLVGMDHMDAVFAAAKEKLKIGGDPELRLLLEAIVTEMERVLLMPIPERYPDHVRQKMSGNRHTQSGQKALTILTPGPHP